MKAVFTVISTCLFALQALAQQGGSVSGSYREREPVIGVVIKLYNAEHTFQTTTVASTEGASFLFENVPPGSYTLETGGGWILKNVIVEAGSLRIVHIDTTGVQSASEGWYVTVIA